MNVNLKELIMWIHLIPVPTTDTYYVEIIQCIHQKQVVPVWLSQPKSYLEICKFNSWSTIGLLVLNGDP